MKCNRDLIELTLRYVEEAADDVNPIPPPIDKLSRFGGESVILGHVRLCEEAGYLELDRSADPPQIVRLTWKGHEHLF